jgi:hypothetical protein
MIRNYLSGLPTWHSTRSPLAPPGVGGRRNSLARSRVGDRSDVRCVDTRNAKGASSFETQKIASDLRLCSGSG